MIAFYYLSISIILVRYWLASMLCFDWEFCHNLLIAIEAFLLNKLLVSILIP